MVKGVHGRYTREPGSERKVESFEYDCFSAISRKDTSSLSALLSSDSRGKEPDFLNEMAYHARSAPNCLDLLVSLGANRNVQKPSWIACTDASKWNVNGYVRNEH